MLIWYLQKLRGCALDILFRLPHNPPEPMRQYAVEIVDKMMNLVRIENEDNAVLCVKIILECVRHQPKTLVDSVQPFLNLIQEMFEMMEQAVKETFDNPVSSSHQGLPGTPGNQFSQSPRPSSPVTTSSGTFSIVSGGATTDLPGEQHQTRQLQKGMHSFKVLAECPIIVVSIFQSHRNFVGENVKKFVPLIKNVLLLQAAPQAKAHEDAKAQGRIFTGVSKDIKNRAAFGDFINAQVKTMSFLAYLLRVYAQQLTDFLPTLPDIVIRMLKDCPRERSGARKELLVAIRHIINFNFRKIFLKKIDELLDERTLIGDGLTVYETMRPLAYSMLADLIHHLRQQLNKEQIRRTIEVYTKNLHDDYPGTSFQTMSAKLLLNMAECIAELEPKEDARHFLIMILNAIGDKFAAMNRQFENAKKLSAQYSPPSIDASAENYMADKDQPPDWDEIDIFSATPIKTSTPRERSSDPVADNKFLFKNLLHGLKNLFYQLRLTNPANIKEEIDSATAPPNWHEVSFGYNAEDVQVLIKLFREGARVFRYYGVDKDGKELNTQDAVATNQPMMTSGKEEKELLESFATVFHHIDPATFHEVFQSEIPHLYDMMFEHNALLHVPQFLLASEATSPSFAGMLLQFLMSKMPEVGTADMKKSSILLRLFKLSFMAVTLFSQQNEQVLLPHVTKIMTQSIQLSTNAEDPMNYFILLRSLFRSIGGGRFEHLYKEILPLLEMLLEVLNNLLSAARKPSERDLFVELSLTVPARLSNLLPHLSYLMRPLVVALRAGSDLVGQGLRTLELCVDNLTADYLDPIMAPVIDELMTALWEHLKPNPYSHFHAHTTMRILGKLGGRNRKFLIGPPELPYKSYADDAPSFDIRLVGAVKERSFPANIGVDHAIAKLAETPKNSAAKKSDTYHKQQAFKLISSHIKLAIGVDQLPEDFVQLVRLQANDLVAKKYDVGSDLLAMSDRDKSIPKRDEQQETLKKLLKACMFACSVDEIKADAETLLTYVTRHLTMLEFGRALANSKKRLKPFDVNAGEGPIFVEGKVISDAIGDSLCSDNIAVREAAEKAILTMKEAAVIIFGASDKIDRLSLFVDLAGIFTHNCHEEEWFVKAGGALGIDILITKVGFSDHWVMAQQMNLVRALMYVLKDMPQDVAAKTRKRAQETLEKILRRCNKGINVKEVANNQTRLHQLCGFLIFELAHSNKHVRHAAQKIFKIVAEVIRCEVHELMTPVKDRLTGTIFNKPLRALPFPIQIGYIDAITFCLETGHALAEFTEPLMRLLLETLALADADDDTLAPNPQEQRNAENIVHLRVACIKLLSIAQGFPEFSTGSPNQSKHRTIQVFFKSLYSKSPEVVDAANSGLQVVLSANNKLPKDLLQSGLRPILMNLQDPKKLTVETLDGLARLLKLLTNYFKVEIGSRLLDHMDTLADTTMLQRVSFTLIEQNKIMRVIAAILNVFHLLPSAADNFLERLVTKVISLEAGLRRTHFSPFREPLIKYLNHYPEKSWQLFAPRIRDQTQGRFFAQILADEGSKALREHIANDVDGFLKTFMFDDPEEEKWPAAINAIHMVWSMHQYQDVQQKLLGLENIRRALLDSAKALEAKLRDNTIEGGLRLAVEQAGEQIMDIFATYMRAETNDLDFFFELVDAVTGDELKQTPALEHFIYLKMVSSENVEFWRTLVHRCIDLYAGRAMTQRAKTFVFHNLVNPILAMDIMRNWQTLMVDKAKGTKLVDKAMIDAVHNKLWKPSLVDTSEDVGQLGVDHSRLELLQTTALLLKYHATHMSDYRKDVIKFGYTWVKLEDIINKHAAYVVIAYFIATYETPQKIANQVYHGLLKAHQNEGRSLVMQALELIAPVLKKRMPGTDGKLLPLWARMPKKVLAEESHNLPQLMSIFNFLVRHIDLFYDAREALSIVVIPALSKIAQPPSLQNENKKLALNLIGMIWQWEERAAREAEDPDAMDIDASPGMKRNSDGTASPPPPKKRDFVAPMPMRAGLIRYLVQFIAQLPERYPVSSLKSKEGQSSSAIQSTEASRKALRLLYNLLSPGCWSDLDVEAVFPKIITPALTTEKQQDEKEESYKTKLINTLQILKVIINVKSNDWVLQRIPKLQDLLEKPARIEDVEMQDCLHGDEGDESDPKLVPLMRRLLDVLPEPAAAGADEDMEEAPGSEFVTFCGTVANEALNVPNLIIAISLLWTLAQRRPEEIDQHVPHLMKIFTSKLIKDNIAWTAQTPQAMIPGGRPDPNNQQEAQEMEIQQNLILKIIDILASRINTLGDQRRPFLSALATLVERSPSNAVCSKVMDLIEGWIFAVGEPIPTMKEKTAVLSKMLFFEQRAEQKGDSSLLDRFLDLVLRIYEDSRITRSELTVRMEPAFLVGCRAADVDIRNRFMSIFDKHITRTASSRLSYVITSQDWANLADSFWLSQVIQLLFGSVEMTLPAQLHAEDFRTLPASLLFGTSEKDPRLADLMIDEKLEKFVAEQRKFCQQIGELKVKDVLEPLGQLQHTDPELAHQIWVAIFPLYWSAFPKDDRNDFEKGLTALVTKDFHTRQIDKRPNCIQSILEGVVRAKPRFKFPPHVMKFLAKTFDAWYTAAHFMEEMAINPIVDVTSVRESNLDALLDIYASLQEDDLFYGTWRRRCQYMETNAALSYEQNGTWDKAQTLYENAQIKARTGVVPFSHAEYLLWEDHWVICAQKLQHWEIIADFAKHENFNDLYLEATWRNIDLWNNNDTREQIDSMIKSVSDAPTPRRRFFEAFMSLLKFHTKNESAQDFNRVCDEAVQLSIRKWHQLPNRITNAHIPILQNFQNLVELHDASVICQSLSTTNMGNLDNKSNELKLLLTTWRERLPNFWDDINAWQDLVTWRQHIFALVNGVYLQLLPPQQGNATGNSYAYRGYHETAWIINRFAHVARKHNLPDVCIQQLGKIYTLPNIEIQEAFLKLREQAKCHYQNDKELNSGLDVINNTNLNYFGNQQKAEFYTLKGMFLNKLGQKTEANDAFGSALYFDIKLPKAWAEWGHYNDMLFKEDPTNLEKASSAISCYLEAAGQFKNAKSRKLNGRILWLLSLDDSEHRLAKTFEEFKGDTPVWFWITYIPQLLLSLSRQEAPIARLILTKLAKAYPQALFFHLRTSREDMGAVKKQQEQKDAREKQAKSTKQGSQGSSATPAPTQGSPTPAKQSSPESRPGTADGVRPSTSNGEAQPNGTPNAPNATPKQEPVETNGVNGSGAAASPSTPKKPWEHTEDIMSVLKTAYPLLAWSMEAMVDQIQKHFKCQPDEDAYRLIVALLNDALTYVGKQPQLYAQDVKLPQATESNIDRFAQAVLPHHIRPSFEEDFVKKKPTMYQYIQKLRMWRNRFEEKLDRRVSPVGLESLSAHLSEIRFQKFDEIEVPGQYLLHKESNKDFVRIERFLPNIDLVRGAGHCHRRLVIRGHDGSVHPFAVQYPAGKHCRREERIVQLFRIFNGVLMKRKESRRRNLQFHLPLMVPLSPNVRLMHDDASHVSLQGIFEDYCRRNGINKDDPILFMIEKLRSLAPVSHTSYNGPKIFANEEKRNNDQYTNTRLETLTAIQDKFVPSTVVFDYFAATYPSFDTFWLFRRAFAYQFATLTFMTHVMHMNSRFPHKMMISREKLHVWGTELVPAMTQQKPIFQNPEPVPFRLTPNLQTLMGPLATEGIFAPAIMAIARCLTEPDQGLTMEMQLAVFVRDEVAWWLTQSHRQAAIDAQMREAVQGNSDIVVRRAKALAQPGENNLPANQTVVDYVAKAVDPKLLSQTDPLWMPYL